MAQYSADLRAFYDFPDEAIREGFIDPTDGIGSILNFTRNSEATYYDERGVLRTAQPNFARLDHDPSTYVPGESGTVDGGLLGAGKTDFTQPPWIGNDNGTGAIDNGDLGPDGSTNAWSMQDTDGSGYHWHDTDSIAAAVGGLPVTLSFYVKKDGVAKTTRFPGLRVLASGGGNPTMTISFATDATLEYHVTDTGGVITNLSGALVDKGDYLRGSITGTMPAGVTALFTEVYPALGAGADLSVSSPSAQAERSNNTDLIIDYIRLAQESEPAGGFDQEQLATVLKLLLEDEATNDLLYSRDFTDASWVKTRTTVQASAIVLPDGSLGLNNKLVANSGAANTHPMAKAVDKGVAEVQDRTWSFYLKANGVTSVQLYVTGATFGENASAQYDLLTGNVTPGGENVFTFLGGTMTALPDGWWDCTISVTTNANQVCQVYVFLLEPGTNGTVWEGDDTSGVYVDWAQLEQGRVATSRIFTTAALTTRPTEVCNTDISSWYSQGAGTLYVEHSAPAIDYSLADVEMVTCFDDTIGSDRWRLYTQSSGTRIRSQSDMNDAGNNVFNVFDNGPGYTDRDGLPHRVAIGIQEQAQGTVALSIDALPLQSTNAATLSSAITHFRLNVQHNGLFNGARRHYKEIRYYNTRRPDSEPYTVPGTGGLEQLSNGEVPEPGLGPVVDIRYQMLI